MFVFLSQPRNGPRQADLAAKRAGVLAEALLENMAWHKMQREPPLEATLEKGRLQDIRGADFHALPAANAQIEKGLFFLRPRGSQ